MGAAMGAVPPGARRDPAGEGAGGPAPARVPTPVGAAGVAPGPGGWEAGTSCGLAPDLFGLFGAAHSLLEALAKLAPELVNGQDAAQAARLMARVAKAATYAEAALAKRAVAAEAHKAAGYVSAPDFVAAQGGLRLGEARGRLALMGALETMPGAREALRSGELSLSQAADLAKAEAACPGAGEALVPVARSVSPEALKDQTAKVLAGALGAEALAGRRRAARCFSSWTDELGMVWLKAALLPEVGQAIVARVEALAQKARRQGRTAGREPEGFGALAADALVDLTLGSGPATPVGAEVVFVVSYDAYRRGHVHPDETCRLLGAGPVPLSTVAAAVPDAFIKALVVKGKDIMKLAHFGRRLSVELKSALLLGPGPGFEGASCAAPGCGRRYGLEIDHRVPLSERGPTSYDNLQPLCKAHHWQKTESDRAAASIPWPERATAEGGAAGGTGGRAKAPPEAPDNGQADPVVAEAGAGDNGATGAGKAPPDQHVHPGTGEGQLTFR